MEPTELILPIRVRYKPTPVEQHLEQFLAEKGISLDGKVEVVNEDWLQFRRRASPQVNGFEITYVRTAAPVGEERAYHAAQLNAPCTLGEWGATLMHLSGRMPVGNPFYRPSPVEQVEFYRPDDGDGDDLVVSIGAIVEVEQSYGQFDLTRLVEDLAHRFPSLHSASRPSTTPKLRMIGTDPSEAIGFAYALAQTYPTAPHEG